MAPRVACVSVPGLRGPSCDAVAVDGPLYGVADAAGAEVIRVRPWPGDRFLLATDGFRELLDDQTLAELAWGEPTHTCTRLHELALDRLAQDAAAVVLTFGEYH
jgi:serine/threonine protein phosphatase PrpC